jgi:hypothetical protein
MPATLDLRPAFRRHSRLPAPLRALATCLVLLGTGGSAAADVILRGTIEGRVIEDNAVVPRGASCVLVNTTIKGNLFVRADARVMSENSAIDGNVQAERSALVDLAQSTVVKGNVQALRTRSVLVRTGTAVDGGVQIVEATAPANVHALLVQDATVKGDVQAEKSSGQLRAVGNAIDGNLQFVENRTGTYAITDNVIKGDLQFFKNKGAGSITGNQVAGNLQSKENSPAPTVSGNVVEGDLEVDGGGGGGGVPGPGTPVSGKIGAVTIDDDLTIAGNSTATLKGTVIQGNLILQAGARLVASGIRVEGNVQAAQGATVDLGRSSVVIGDVQGIGTASIAVRGATCVGGNVQLQSGSAGGGNALLVQAAEVEGDVQAEKSAGPIRVTGTRIGGNLQIVENTGGKYDLTNNVISGDLQFFKNSGGGKITGNRVGGNLQSKENTPAPVVKRNTVAGNTELE